MDQYNLRPDPCDNQIIRLTNCLTCMSIVFDILALFVKELRHLAHIIDVMANMVFYTTIGCMNAQVNAEIDHRRQTYTTHTKIAETDTLLDKHEYQ